MVLWLASLRQFCSRGQESKGHAFLVLLLFLQGCQELLGVVFFFMEMTDTTRFAAGKIKKSPKQWLWRIFHSFLNNRHYSRWKIHQSRNWTQMSIIHLGSHISIIAIILLTFEGFKSTERQKKEKNDFNLRPHQFTPISEFFFFFYL